MLDLTPELEYSFDDLCLPLCGEMTNYARKLTGGDAQRAADIVQDSLTKAFAAWPRWRPDGDPAGAARAWLYRIVCNTFTKAYHHHGIRRRALFQRWHDVVASVHGDDVSVGAREVMNTGGGGDTTYYVAGIRDAHEEEPFGDEVLAALAELVPDHRVVIEMYYVRDFGCERIARELKIPKNTVFTRLARARAALGVVLKKFARAEYGYGLRRADEEAVEPANCPQPKTCSVDGIMSGLDAEALLDGESAPDQLTARR